MFELLKEIPLKVQGKYRTVEQTLYFYGAQHLPQITANLPGSMEPVPLRASSVQICPTFDTPEVFFKRYDVIHNCIDRSRIADTSRDTWLSQVLTLCNEQLRAEANTPSLEQINNYLANYKE